jgi:hypothetical protein
MSTNKTTKKETKGESIQIDLSSSVNLPKRKPRISMFATSNDVDEAVKYGKHTQFQTLEVKDIYSALAWYYYYFPSVNHLMKGTDRPKRIDYATIIFQLIIVESSDIETARLESKNFKNFSETIDNYLSWKLVPLIMEQMLLGSDSKTALKYVMKQENIRTQMLANQQLLNSITNLNKQMSRSRGFNTRTRPTRPRGRGRGQ